MPKGLKGFQKGHKINVGRKCSDEKKRRIGTANSGAIFSDEHRKKMRENHADFNGKNNPNWRGGTYIDRYGYIHLYKPHHHGADHAGYVFKHRLVMEKSIGRHLTEEEVVHHIDGDKKNNVTTNLMLFSSNGEHVRHHLQSKSP